MPNLTSITVANGLPTAGTGTVGTVDVLLGAGASVEVVPTVTAGAYAAGEVVGGIMTFANILAPNSNGGILESITLKFKGTVQTVEFDVALFDTSPAGTFTDNNPPVINATDTAHLLGVFPMVNNQSSLGTHTIYALDGIGKSIIGASQSLYAVVTAKAVPVNLASTSDMLLKISLAW